MSDLISRQDAVDALNRVNNSYMDMKGHPMPGWLTLLDEIADIPSVQKRVEWTRSEKIEHEIEDAPSIDIVKCADCTYDHQCNHSVQRITSKPDYMSIIYVPIGWCERGERRER